MVDGSSWGNRLTWKLENCSKKVRNRTNPNTDASQDSKVIGTDFKYMRSFSIRKLYHKLVISNQLEPKD